MKLLFELFKPFTKDEVKVTLDEHLSALELNKIKRGDILKCINATRSVGLVEDAIYIVVETQDDGLPHNQWVSLFRNGYPKSRANGKFFESSRFVRIS